MIVKVKKRLTKNIVKLMLLLNACLIIFVGCDELEKITLDGKKIDSFYTLISEPDITEDTSANDEISETDIEKSYDKIIDSEVTSDICVSSNKNILFTKLILNLSNIDIERITEIKAKNGSNLDYRNAVTTILANASRIGFKSYSDTEIPYLYTDSNKQKTYSYIAAKGYNHLKLSIGEEELEVEGVNKYDHERLISYYGIDCEESKECLIIGLKNEKDIKEDLTINYVFDKEESVINSEAEKVPLGRLDVSVEYENYYLTVKSESDDVVSVSPEGSIGIAGDSKDFEFKITANEGDCPLEWHTISVRVGEGTNPKLSITESGYELSGVNLKDIKISAHGDIDPDELQVININGAVSITQKDKAIDIKADDSSDGEFTLSRDNNQLNSKVAAVVIVFCLLIVILIIAIVMLSRKKKKSAEYFDIPVCDSSVSYMKSSDLHNVSDKNEIGIVVLTGRDAGRKYRFRADKKVRVGKDARKSDVVIDKRYIDVSRFHCTIVFDYKNNRYFVIDNSSNGTYFEDGNKMVRGELTPVQRGAVIRLSQRGCKIELL